MSAFFGSGFFVSGFFASGFLAGLAATAFAGSGLAAGSAAAGLAAAFGGFAAGSGFLAAGFAGSGFASAGFFFLAAGLAGLGVDGGPSACACAAGGTASVSRPANASHHDDRGARLKTKPCSFPGRSNQVESPFPIVLIRLTKAKLPENAATV
jgi:hypothetical protein